MNKDQRTIPRLLMRAYNIFLCNYVVCRYLASMFGFSVSPAIILATTAAALLSVTACSLGRFRTGATTVYMFGVMFAGAIFYDRLRTGWEWFGTRFLKMLASNYDMDLGEIVLKKGSSQRDFLLILVMFLMCMILAIAYESGKNYFGWVSVALAMVVVSLIMNIFPGSLEVVLFFCMMVFFKITVSWERAKGNRIVYYEFGIIAVLALCTVCFMQIFSEEKHEESLESGRVRAYIRRVNNQAGEKIGNFINKRFNQQKEMANAGMAGGVVAKGGIVFSDKTDLLVVVPKDVPQFYLKGYTGATYVNGCWQEDDPTSRRQYYWDDALNSMVSYEPEKNLPFFVMNQLYTDAYRYYDLTDIGLSYSDWQFMEDDDWYYYVVAKYNNTVLNSLRKDIMLPLYRATFSAMPVGADASYTYVPYCSYGSISYNSNMDFIYNREGIPNYLCMNFPGYMDSPSQSVSYYEGSNLLTTSFGGKAKRWSDAYWDYTDARMYYLDVDSRFSTLLWNEVKDHVNDTLEEKVEFVKRYMRQNFTYTTDPPKNQSGKDPVQFFIEDSHAGFCQHFASTAVMMFRLLGIPTRYVEGYIVDSQSIARGTEERWDAVEIAYRDEQKTELMTYVAVKVPNQNAHAWAEIYIQGYGWYPIEVTVGYDRNNEIRYTPSQSVTPTAKSGTPTPGTTRKPLPTGTKKQNTPAEEKTEKRMTPKQMVAWGLVAIFVIAAVVLLMRFGIRRARRRRIFGRKRGREVAVFVYGEIIRLLAYYGLKRAPQEADREFHQRLAPGIPEFQSDTSFAEIVVIAERAAFSEDVISETEIAAMKRYFHGLRKAVLAKKNILQKAVYLLSEGR